MSYFIPKNWLLLLSLCSLIGLSIPKMNAAIIVTPKVTTIQNKAKHKIKRNRIKQVNKRNTKKYHPNHLQDDEKGFPWGTFICLSLIGILLGLIILGAVLGIPALWIVPTVILGSFILGLAIILVFVIGSFF
jgi:hypothetical protein